MEMHQVRYFLAVAQTLNFTHAAERCNVSPPSLLRAIRLLEAEFGGALFRRERARTHLTELGKIALPHLEQIAASASMAKHETSRATMLEESMLKLGIMCTIAPEQFLELVAAFRERWPGVVLTIVDNNAAMLQEALLAGELDVAVYASPGQKFDSRLHTLSLFDEEMFIVLPEGHALASKPKLLAQELNNLSYVERINCEFSEYGETVFSGLEVTSPTICRSERDDWVLGMVSQNFGYSFMPAASAVHPGIVARRLENMPMFRSVNLVTVRGRKHSPAVGAFVRLVMRLDWNKYCQKQKAR